GKTGGLSPRCRSCDVLSSCHGGCPKDRDRDGLNRLCAAYQRFFRHARPGLQALAAHLNTGKPLRTFRYQAV
ncbi:MAG TPA: anaerobic sulfatase maturase, partial [Spirochaetia bacterium]|nr:anaerobic sulfatase maturase [Spirochaetia bacterium]